MNLSDIKEALSKATPGPWEWHESDDGHEIRMGTSVDSPSNCEVQHLIDYDHGLWEEDESQYEEAEANALLIGNATQWLASLVSQVEEMQKTLEHAARIIDSGMGAGILRYDPISWFMKYHQLLKEDKPNDPKPML